MALKCTEMKPRERILRRAVGTVFLTVAAGGSGGCAWLTASPPLARTLAVASVPATGSAPVRVEVRRRGEDAVRRPLRLPDGGRAVLQAALNRSPPSGTGEIRVKLRLQAASISEPPRWRGIADRGIHRAEVRYLVELQQATEPRSWLIIGAAQRRYPAGLANSTPRRRARMLRLAIRDAARALLARLDAADHDGLSGPALRPGAPLVKRGVKGVTMATARESAARSTTSNEAVALLR